MKNKRRFHRCRPRPVLGESGRASVAARIGPTMGRPGNLVGPDDRGGGDHVMHICPACGGPLAANHGALIVVQVCLPCRGTGLMTDAQLSAYLASNPEP